MTYLFLFYFIFYQGGNNIEVKSGWLRPAPATFNTAFYCTIINNGNTADTLYKAASGISDDVQIHETYMKNDMVGMRPVKFIVIAPYDSLIFKPGGYHIMMMNLKESVVENATKEISLFFNRSGEVKVKANVKSQH
jgi:copper(I)-binding protein